MITETMMMMIIMMMAVIAMIKYFRLPLAHQRIHLILLLLLLSIRGQAKKAGARGEMGAAAATLSQHWRMHAVLMSLPQLTPRPQNTFR